MTSDSNTEITDDLSIHREVGIRTKTNNFARWYNAGLFKNVDKDFANEVQDYWMKHYNKEIDPYLHIASMNLTGKKDPRFIPQRLMHREILPVFNDFDKSLFYADKNLYDIVINPSRSVETVLRNINGLYFDADHQSINFEKANDILVEHDRDLIIKPSQTNNGTDIRKISIKDKVIYSDKETVSFKDLEKIYEENFIVQKVLQQHPNLAAPHPSSINTLRMVTFRWKNEIKYLMTFVRFGDDNGIKDNGGDGNTPRLGVSDTGEFFKVGVSQNGEEYTHHPTTGFSFADLEPIPNFDEFKQFVIDCHKKILHLNLASWDIVVGTDGKPIFLEVNFAGLTSFYQLVTNQPMFGDMTEEVLEHVQNELAKKEPVLMYRHRRKIAEREAQKKEKEITENNEKIRDLTRKNKRLRKQRRSLREQLSDQEEEMIKVVKDHKIEVERLHAQLSKHKDKYKTIKNSKSYRYTKPLRKILKRF